MPEKKPYKKVLPIEDIVLDAGTQSRVAISEVTVEDYAEILADSNGKFPFPELAVFHDGNRYLLASGFHRALASLRAGRKDVPCWIHQGTAWDALLFGMVANQKNPLRPTREDKHHAVEMLLDSKKKLTQTQIAGLAGVSHRTVKRIVAERKGSMAPSGDPFDVDQEVSRTDSGGQEAQMKERPPGSRGDGKETPEGASTPPKQDEFKIQKAKTVKTAEALARAFCDLNRLKKSKQHEAVIASCTELIVKAKGWK